MTPRTAQQAYAYANPVTHPDAIPTDPRLRSTRTHRTGLLLVGLLAIDR